MLRLAIWPEYQLRQGDLRAHLCRQEGLVMTALLAHREVRMELITEVLWPDADRMPDQWYRALAVCLTKLRVKLAPFGYTIAARYGFGWRLIELADGETAKRAA
ncbi:MAG TPA: hypothetical protein VGA50_04695 [Kiloniellales bacterium]